MSISLNALFYGDKTSKALEKGCSFCKKKHQCRIAYTSFSNECKDFDHTEMIRLFIEPEKENINRKPL